MYISLLRSLRRRPSSGVPLLHCLAGRAHGVFASLRPVSYSEQHVLVQQAVVLALDLHRRCGLQSHTLTGRSCQRAATVATSYQWR
jgi:hypothetical protein